MTEAEVMDAMTSWSRMGTEVQILTIPSAFSDCSVGETGSLQGGSWVQEFLCIGRGLCREHRTLDDQVCVPA